MTPYIKTASHYLSYYNTNIYQRHMQMMPCQQTTSDEKWGTKRLGGGGGRGVWGWGVGGKGVGWEGG